MGEAGVTGASAAVRVLAVTHVAPALAAESGAGGE
jgi:hypothetical protein